MSDFNISGCLIALAFVFFFAGIVIWMVHSERAKKEAEQEALSAFGFHPMAQPDPAILEKLDNLYRRSPKQKFELRSLYEKPAPDGKYLVFVLVETSGEDYSYLGTNAVAVIDPGLILPRAYIFGRLSMQGQTAGWMVKAAEKVMDWAVSRGHYERMNLAQFPELDSKLIVLLGQEYEGNTFFTADRLGRLTWIAETGRFSSIDCCGDIFILGRQVTPAHPNPEKDLADLLRDAQQAWMGLA